MKIQFMKKAILITGIFLILSFVLEIVGMQSILTRNEVLNLKTYEETFTSIIDNIMKNEEEELLIRLYDYSVWDDMYMAVENLNYQWAGENATEFLYEDEAYNLDLIFVIGTNNDYYEFYGEKNFDKVLLKSEILNMVKEKGEEFLSYIEFEGNVYRIAISPIFLNHRNSSNGYYVMGQKLDYNSIKKLSSKFFNMKEFLGNDYFSLYEKKKIEKNGIMDIEYKIMDFNGENIKSIHYYFDRSEYIRNYQKLFNHTILISIIIFLFLGISIFIAIRKIRTVGLKITEEIEIVAEGNYGYEINKTNIKELDLIIKHVNILRNKVTQNIYELENSNIETMEILINLIEEKDKYTGGHSERVMEISLILGKVLGYSDIAALKEAALLHDIGKIGIEEKILIKPEKLTKDEYEIIKTHPEKGENILNHSSRLLKVAILVRQHHERFDGFGYPDGVRGNRIEYGSRIIAVADSFDAMTSERPYRKAMTFEEAVVKINEESGRQFDPKVVDAFLSSKEILKKIIDKKFN